jgi:alkylhydroperoxidase family enzyme
MKRVNLIEPEAADGETARLYEAVTQMLGRVPHSYRALAHTPHVARVMLPFNAVLQREGAGSLLSTKIKEMAIIKTSKLNGCAY